MLVYLAFVSTCASITRGHRAISRQVLRSFMHAQQMINSLKGDEVQVEIVSSLALKDDVTTVALLHSLAKTGHVIVVVDFPDLPHSPELVDIVTCANDSIYLAMSATSEYDKSLDEAPVLCWYDYVVALEPSARRPMRKGMSGKANQDADYRIAPLIQDLVALSDSERSWADTLLAPSRYYNVLSVNAGFAQEEEGVERWLRSEHAESLLVKVNNSNRETRVIPSVFLEHVLRSQLPSSLLLGGVIRWAELFDHIIASPGYSTFWELYTLGLQDRTTWIKLDRPVESIDSRLRLMKKKDMLDRGTAASSKLDPNSGVLALGKIVADIVFRATSL